MKPKQLRTFLEEFIVAQGGAAERRGENLLALTLPEEPAAVVGASEVVLAFNLRGLQEDPRSELGTVGNPLFDRILELARTAGRVGERYRPAGKPPARPPDPLGHFRFEGLPVEIGKAVASYAPLYFFLFRTEYSLEDQADELEIVALDGVSHETLGQMPELIEFWEALAAAPAPDRQFAPAFPVPEPALRAGAALLEKRLRKRIARIRRDAEQHLRRETENIENYYRQLIEESRNAGRRWAMTAAQKEERVRVLQLDWKRRVEEAHQHWRPRIDVRLASVAAAMLPRLAWDVTVAAEKPRTRGRGNGVASRPAARASKKEKKEPGFRVWWDEAEKRFVNPPCPRCGAALHPVIVVTADGFRCPDCADADSGAVAAHRPSRN